MKLSGCRCKDSWVVEDHISREMQHSVNAPSSSNITHSSNSSAPPAPFVKSTPHPKRSQNPYSLIENPKSPHPPDIMTRCQAASYFPLLLANSRPDFSTAIFHFAKKNFFDDDMESLRPRVADASTRATQLNWTNFGHLWWVGCCHLLYIDSCETVGGLAGGRRWVAWSRWFGHCVLVGRCVCWSVWVSPRAWLVLSAGRCGLVAVCRLLRVGCCGFVAVRLSVILGSLCVGRHLSVTVGRSVATSRCEQADVSCLLCVIAVVWFDRGKFTRLEKNQEEMRELYPPPRTASPSLTSFFSFRLMNPPLQKETRDLGNVRDTYIPSLTLTI